MDTPHDSPVESLTLPIDQHVLTCMQHGRRETPINTTATIKHNNPDTDLTRNYVGNRLRNLEIRGYLHSPGPADQSSMYEITVTGRVAATKINRYVRDYDHTFHRLVTRTAASQPGTPDPNGWYPDDLNTTYTPDPCSETITDWIHLTPIQQAGLNALIDVGSLTIPTDFVDTLADHINTDMDLDGNTAAETLYALYVHGFVERQDDMDAYAPVEEIVESLRADPSISNQALDGCRRADLFPE